VSTSVVPAEAVAREESGAAPGSRRCQVFWNAQGFPWEEFRRWQDFIERCPNQAEALIWYQCPNGCQYPEEVCRWHTEPPGKQWCGSCMARGVAAQVTITIIGRI
jgi:hypothetical protein